MKTSLIAVLSLLSLAVPGLLRAADAPPNIIYLISDDHAWTDYGFMGHPVIETPNLDKLASRSGLFSRGYVPTSLPPGPRDLRERALRSSARGDRE